MGDPGLAKAFAKTAAILLGAAIAATPLAAKPQPRPAPQPAKAVPAKPAPAQWHTEVSVIQQSWDYIADPTKVGDGGWSMGGWREWLDPAQIPADLRSAPLKTRTKLVLTFSPVGVPEDCAVTVPASDPRLDRLACESLMARARLGPAYSAPGKPVAFKINFMVRFNTMPMADYEAILARPVPMAVAPPADPGTLPEYAGWPRQKWQGGLLIAAFPNLQALYPAEAGKAEGKVSLELQVSPDTGAVDCTIGVSSGNAALDRKSCEVGQKLQLAYPTRCFPCSVRKIPLQFVWNKRKGSHIRVPLGVKRSYNPTPDYVIPHDPLDPRTATIQKADRAVLIPMTANHLLEGIDRASVTNRRPRLEVSVDAEGRITACNAGWSTGNRELDGRLCAEAMKAVRYSVVEDVFGDPVGSGNSRVYLALRIDNF